ncbi:unnamed protein product, partial [marine sediment metagenome]
MKEYQFKLKKSSISTICKLKYLVESNSNERDIEFKNNF